MIKEIPSSFSITLDGSPTLAYGPAEEVREKMHHEAGALSETVFIYGRGVDYVIANKLAPRFAIVGLGLAYIEMMTAAKFLDEPLFIRSFEKEEFLRAKFLEWLKKNVTSPGSHDSFHSAYDDILSLTARRFGVSPKTLKERLLFLWESGFWEISGELSRVTYPSPEPFSAILFDAFSSKTSPELWEQHFLENFLKSFAAPSCVFTSYASTGDLKRALKKQGFQIHESPGFYRKRESTLAIRSFSII